MWAFPSARLRLWLLLAVGAPVLSWLLGTIGDRLETRSGPTTTSRALPGHVVLSSPYLQKETAHMLALIAILLVVWLVLSILGAVIKGLFWLTIVGVVLFLGTAAYGYVKHKSRGELT